MLDNHSRSLFRPSLYKAISVTDIFTAVFCLTFCAFFIRDRHSIYPTDIQALLIMFLATILASTYFSIKLASQRQQSITLSTADIFVVLLLTWVTFCSCFLHPPSLHGFYVMGTCLSYLIFKQFFYARTEKLMLVSTAILLVGVLQVVFAGFQLFDIIPTQGLYKMVGGFDNPGPLGICISSILVFSIGLYYGISNTTTKTISFITCLACILILPASDSRAAWLGLAAGGLFLWTKQPIWDRFKKSSFFLPVALAVASVFLVLCIYLWKHKEDSALGRLLIWRVSSNLIMDHPLTGIGSGHFRHQYPHYQADYFSNQPASDDSKEVLLSDMVEYAFCDVIQFTSEMGIPGGTIFLLFLWFLIFAPLNPNPQAQAARAAIICMIVAGFVSYPLQLASIWWLFLICAIIVSCSLTHFKKISLSIKLVPRIVIICLLMLVSGAMYFILLINFQAKREWLLADRAFQEGNLLLAENKFKAVIAAIPYDSEPLLFYGKILMLTQRNNEASEVFLSAADKITDPFLYCNLGDVSTSLGDYEAAEESYKMANFITPNRMYPKYLLALHYRRIGDSRKADSMATYISAMTVKVRSDATDEMKTEMLQLLRETNR